MRHINKQVLAVTFAVIVLLIGGAFFLLSRGGAVITVYSEEGAEISVATERGGKFNKIGEGKASFTVKKIPSDVYFMSSKDSRKTISGIVVEQKEEIELRMELSETQVAERYYEGSVSFPFIHGTQVQGIDTATSSLTSFRTDQFAPPRLEFIGIPYLKRVAWQDADNFIYNSFNQGLGAFINSANQSDKQLADVITDKDNRPIENSIADNQSYFVDVSKHTGRPFVLLSNNALYTSDDVGVTLRKIAEFNGNSETQTVHSDDNYIFRFAEEPPAVYADETPDVSKEDLHEEHFSSLHQYDYNGSLIRKADTGFESILKAGSLGNAVFILDTHSLVSIDDGSEYKLPLYFEYPRDLIVYNDEVVLLADNGLWKLSQDKRSVQLLFSFEGNGVGLANSLALIDSGESLVFGTNPRPESTDTQNVTFKLTFSR